MAELDLIAWPYHAGLADVSMGLGARVLAADEEFRTGLAQTGFEPRVVWVPPVDETLPEVARIFELVRRLARRVAHARARKGFPLVLGGNCASCLGTTAGAGGGQGLGVVWLDAHADFDTPEDNLSGFTDVMGLAILTGGCWRALRETIPDFRVVDEDSVVLVGTRDLEPYQRDRLTSSRLQIVPGAVATDALERAVDGLRKRVERVYLHIDLDVLDTSVGRPNAYAAPGGPDLDGVLAAVSSTFARFDVAAAALTAYDPRLDGDGSVAAAANAIARRIATLASRQR
ncbi:MAG: arginase family protein [Solirubrobacterales bacterium]|nr:arginase family protein [Solirubrobacterales bacterium]